MKSTIKLKDSVGQGRRQRGGTANTKENYGKGEVNGSGGGELKKHQNQLSTPHKSLHTHRKKGRLKHGPHFSILVLLIDLQTFDTTFTCIQAKAYRISYSVYIIFTRYISYVVKTCNRTSYVCVWLSEYGYKYMPHQAYSKGSLWACENVGYSIIQAMQPNSTYTKVVCFICAVHHNKQLSQIC